jgi:hypothetical protein
MKSRSPSITRCSKLPPSPQLDAPHAVCELNEAGFEAAARECHLRLGMVTPAKLNQMLEEFGF